jgi:DNA-binding NtrC family response regulator
MSAVLIVEDERGIREGLATTLARVGMTPITASGIADARARLSESTAFTCVLVDIRLRDGSGLDLLREIRQGRHRDVPVIVATAYDDGSRTIEAMRDGAFDYLTKPFDLPRLVSAVERAVRTRKETRPPETSRAARESDAKPKGLVGRSVAMHPVWKLIGRAAATRVPVLVRGETGVGKEIVARAIREHSPLAERGLEIVRVDAQTDGDALARTVREAAEGLTLLLDGVGQLSPAAQSRLASALADGPRARVVATLLDTPDEQRVLAPELYFQLAVVEIAVPPLRARRADIPQLVACALAETPRTLSEEAMAALTAHDWPGNVRELFLVVRRAATLASADVVGTHDLHVDLPLRRSAEDAPSRYEGLPLRDAIAKLERDLLTSALRRAEGNRTLAARLLGIARPQLYVKLEEHGLEAKKARP